jgi:hypothetical protein
MGSDKVWYYVLETTRIFAGALFHHDLWQRQLLEVNYRLRQIYATCTDFFRLGWIWPRRKMEKYCLG